MKTKELDRYRELSKEMRGLPRQLSEALGDALPVGHQLFLCCNLGRTWKQPRDCADPVWDKMELSQEGFSTAWQGRSLEPPPLTDAAWAQFMAANYGKLSKEMASWENWERFNDRTACSRFYGCGNKDDLYKITEIVTKAGLLLVEYEKLNVPEELEWATPEPVRFFYNCSLPEYECMLELISREAGQCGDENLIDVEQCGLEVHFEEIVSSPIPFIGDSKLGKLERAGLELFQVDDFCTAFAKAIEAWIPENAEIANSPCDPDEDGPPQRSPDLKLSDEEIQSVSTDGPTHGVSVPVASEELKPTWDNRELRLGNKLIKRFRQKVGNQEIVLAAFQEEGWPHSIDDPLSPAKGRLDDPIAPDKRRRDTVRGLNSNHQNENLIRFETCGETIVWELVIGR